VSTRDFLADRREEVRAKLFGVSLEDGVTEGLVVETFEDVYARGCSVVDIRG